jgi:TPR repeat protein
MWIYLLILFIIIFIGFIIYYTFKWHKPIIIKEEEVSFLPSITKQDIQEVEKEELNSLQLFKLAETYHYGRFNIVIDLNKAIRFYQESIHKSSNRLDAGKCFMALGRLFAEGSQTLVPDAAASIECYLKALECGYEDAILDIAKIYMDGLHRSENTIIPL